MYSGFPVHLLATLRCPNDDGELGLSIDTGSRTHVVTGVLRCSACSKAYAIEQGIVRFLDTSAMDSASNAERVERDKEVVAMDPAWENSVWSRLEVTSMTEACEPLAGALVLELGAGTGRHTAAMIAGGASVIAVDFSAVSIEKAAERAQPDWDLGFVHADCTTLRVQPAAFDLVVSTLVSNLPSAEHRAATMRVAARACKPTARFVFGTHYYGLRARFAREAKAGSYRDGEIFRYLFRQREIRVETQRFFDEVKCRPIQVMIPFAQRLHLPIEKLSRAAERVPLLNQLGALLLVTARSPSSIS